LSISYLQTKPSHVPLISSDPNFADLVLHNRQLALVVDEMPGPNEHAILQRSIALVTSLIITDVSHYIPSGLDDNPGVRTSNVMWMTTARTSVSGNNRLSQSIKGSEDIQEEPNGVTRESAWPDKMAPSSGVMSTMPV
jgi:hypothetical protein